MDQRVQPHQLSEAPSSACCHSPLTKLLKPSKLHLPHHRVACVWIQPTHALLLSFTWATGARSPTATRNKETLAWRLGEGRGLGRQFQQGGAGEGLSPSRVTRETLGRGASCQPDTHKSPQEGRGGEGSEHGVLQWLHGEGWGVQRRESPHVLLV